MNLDRTEIGLLLLSLSILGILNFVWVWPLGALLIASGLLETLYTPTSAFSDFLLNAVYSCPSIVLAIAGLIMYLRGRRVFWKADNRRYSVQLVLLSVGLILVVLGAFFTLLIYDLSVYYAGKTSTALTEHLFRSSPYFVWFSLWIFAGFALLLDLLAHARQRD